MFEGVDAVRAAIAEDPSIMLTSIARVVAKRPTTSGAAALAFTLMAFYHRDFVDADLFGQAPDDMIVAALMMAQMAETVCIEERIRRVLTDDADDLPMSREQMLESCLMAIHVGLNAIDRQGSGAESC